jgi:DNA gyrase/topoisomerase IV subunit A
MSSNQSTEKQSLNFNDKEQGNNISNISDITQPQFCKSLLHQTVKKLSAKIQYYEEQLQSYEKQLQSYEEQIEYYEKQMYYYDRLKSNIEQQKREDKHKEPKNIKEDYVYGNRFDVAWTDDREEFDYEMDLILPY